MKRIIQKTAELIALIEKEIKERKKFYASHWKLLAEANKTAEHIEKTALLEEKLNQLNDLICELNENA